MPLDGSPVSSPQIAVWSSLLHHVVLVRKTSRFLYSGHPKESLSMLCWKHVAYKQTTATTKIAAASWGVVKTYLKIICSILEELVHYPVSG